MKLLKLKNDEEVKKLAEIVHTFYVWDMDNDVDTRNFCIAILDRLDVNWKWDDGSEHVNKLLEQENAK